MKNQTTRILFTCIVFFSLSGFSNENEKKANTTPSASPAEKKESKDPVDLKSLQEPSFLSTLDYPELQVVPRASERLSLEAVTEKESGWTLLWPMETSAVMTIISGVMFKGKVPTQENESDDAYDKRRRDSDFAATAAIGVGAMWLGFSVYVLSTEPYNTELSRIRKIKGTDKKNDLLRERLAEEALQRPAELIKTLTWTSVLTNAAVSLNLFDKATSSMNIYPLLSFTASFIPVIFPSKYYSNYEKHLEYKRKIYAPVVNTYLEKSPVTQEYRPKVLLTWNF